jgi:hypothetical protein
MRRKGLWVGAWALATLGATLVSWAAVRQVTAEVSPSQTLPFPSAVALADDPVAEPDTTAPAPTAPAEPDTDAPATTESYRLTGGLVTVRYRGTATTLVSAAPNSGFGAEVNDTGPEKVDVRFRSDGHESRFSTRLRGGTPDPQTEERAR